MKENLFRKKVEIMTILILYPTCPHLGQQSVSVGVAWAGGGGHLGLLTGVSLLGGLSVLHGSWVQNVILLVLCLVSTLGMVAEVGCHPGHRSTDTAYRSREPWERTGGYKVTPEYLL